MPVTEVQRQNLKAALGIDVGYESQRLDNLQAQGGFGRSEPAGIYKPIGWGSNWKKALASAKAGTGKATAAFVTDSTGRFWASDPVNKGWVGLVKSQLQADFADGGSGFIGAADLVRLAGQVGNSYGAGICVDTSGTTFLLNGGSTYALNLQGSTGAGTTEGPGFGTVSNQASNGAAAAVGGWTFYVRGRFISVYYATGLSAGTAAWTIDGVAQTPLNLALAAGINRITVDLGAGNTGPHTVVITGNATANNIIYLMGVSGENSTGVIVNHFARNGITTAGINSAQGFLWGTVNNADWNGGINYPCDLLVLGGGLINDAFYNVSGDSTMTNLRKFIHRIKNTRNDGGPDLAFVVPPAGSWENANTATILLYTDMLARLRGIAESYGAALIDLWTVVTANSYAVGTARSVWSDGTASGNPGSDLVHPGNLGAAQYFTAAYPTIGG